MHSVTSSTLSLTALLLSLVTAPASATTIDFDGLDHAELVSDQFSELGVLFGTGEEFGTDQVVAFAITSGSCCGSSEPRNLHGATPGGGHCPGCSIIVTFLDPIPQEVTLDVTDPDIGQRVLFVGDSSVLYDHVIGSGSSSNVSQTVSFADPTGIRKAILITSGHFGIGLDDLIFENPVTIPEMPSPFANNFHLVLNGFSQEVHASDGYEGILGTGARTVSWWYRSHQTSFPTVWGLVHWGAPWTVQLESFEDGILNLEAGGTTGGTKLGWSALRNLEIASLQDGQWHQLVLTAPESGTMDGVRLYLDGKQIPVVTVVGGTLTTAYNTVSNLPHSIFRVGARPLGNHASADMDEVALWDTELTAPEVAEIFNGGTPTDLTQNGSSYMKAADLQLYWRFEESAGFITADLSGNSHKGQLIAGNSISSWGLNPPGSGADLDGDGTLDSFDNCPGNFNPDQADTDADQIGDACDPFPDDAENDLAQCETDFVQTLSDLSQVQSELAACLATPPVPDSDGDGVVDNADNCVERTNPVQTDTDQDGYGNRCDGDFDNSGFVDGHDFSSFFLPEFSAGADSGIGTDMTGDGDVDGADFELFMDQFSSGAPGQSGLDCAGTVPCRG